MKVITAYLLAVLGNNSSPCTDDLKNVLSCVCVEADDDRLELLQSEVKGEDITESITAGRKKLAFVSAGGGVIPMAAPAGVGGGASAAPSTAESKR